MLFVTAPSKGCYPGSTTSPRDPVGEMSEEQALLYLVLARQGGARLLKSNKNPQNALANSK
jgi:hypothetical protein